METKRAKVVMLPTATKPYKMPYNEHIPKGAVIRTEMWGVRTQGTVGALKVNNGQSISNYSNEMYYHLYFITDDEIKSGNNIFLGMSNKIAQAKEDIKSGEFGIRKVVATTDPKLRMNESVNLGYCETQDQIPLPQPSQSFIEKYCKVGGINEVLIETEQMRSATYISSNKGTGEPFETWDRIKVDSHNTITIHPIKNSWSREEVEELLHRRTHETTEEIMKNL